MLPAPTSARVGAWIGTALLAQPTSQFVAALFRDLGHVQGAGALCFAAGMALGPVLWRAERPRWLLLGLLSLMCAGTLLWAVGGGTFQQRDASTTTLAILTAIMWVASLKAIALMWFARWEMPRDVIERWEREKKLAPA